MSQLTSLSGLGPLGPLGTLTQRPFLQPNQPAIPPLNPEEESTLLGRVGSSALHGLGYIGGVLEKSFGGRAIRGLLGGRPEEMLSIIPGSDTLWGLTDPKNKVTGAELLGAKDASLFSPEGLAGFGVDILTDPATFLTGPGAALTRAGQVAEKAGTLAPTMFGRMGLKQGGLFGLGLPFQKPAAVFGANPETVQNLQAIGTALQPLAHYSGAEALYNMAKPVYHTGRALFDKAVMGYRNPHLQEGAADASSHLEKYLLPNAREDQLAMMRWLGPEGLKQHRAIRASMEGLPVYGPMPKGVSLQGIQDAGDLANFRNMQMIQEAERLGKPISELIDQPLGGDLIRYAMRSYTPPALGTKGYSGYSGKAADLIAGNPNLMHRLKPFVGIPGGTNALEDMLTDKMLKEMAGSMGAHGAGTATRDATAEAIRNQYFQTDAAKLATMAPDEAKALVNQSKELVSIIQNTDPKHAMEGAAYFGRHPLTDWMTRQVRHHRDMAALGAGHTTLANVANPEYAAQAGDVALTQVLKDMGLGHAGPAGAGPVLNPGAEATQQYLLGTLGKGQNVGEMFVPKDIAADITRVHKMGSQPEAVQKLVDVYDVITNITKAAQTSPWPAFHARNFLTGVVQDLLSGIGLGSRREAATLHAGQAIPGAENYPMFKNLGLTSAEATEKLADQGYKYGLIGRAGRSAVEQTATSGLGIGEIAPRIPFIEGTPGPTIWEGAKKWFPRSWQEAFPWNIRGGAANENVFSMAKSGQHIAGITDEQNYMSQFLGRLKQGYAPEVAGEMAKKVHYDYSQLSDFERNVMRRLVPFYGWARMNTPYVLGQLAEHPGGATSTLIKGAAAAKGQDPGFVPDYLGGGIAAKLGTESPEGTQRFLSNMGLPVEDVAQQLSVKGVLGGLNPLIKMPLETATGKQFFSGRDLADLHTMTGNTFSDQLIMNSPLGRLSTAARTAMDPRKDLLAKALNLTSGIHVADVDMNKARDVAARNYIEQILQGSPRVRHFQEFSVPAAQVGQLTPQEYEMMRLYRTREQEAQRRAAALRRQQGF